MIAIHSSVTEAATGITLNGTKNITRFENMDVKLSFDGTPTVFKPRFPTVGKVITVKPPYSGHLLLADTFSVNGLILAKSLRNKPP